jgi:hypothetical protein
MGPSAIAADLGKIVLGLPHTSQPSDGWVFPPLRGQNNFTENLAEVPS